MLNSPDTAASTEGSFSKLKLIKNFNRSHMTDSRLTSWAMLLIEASCVCFLDLDGAIKAFACQKTHSKPFRYYNNMTLFTIVSWLMLCNIFRRCYTTTQPPLSLSCPSVRRWRCSTRFLVSAHVAPKAEAQTRLHTAQVDPCRVVVGGGWLRCWCLVICFATATSICCCSNVGSPLSQTARHSRSPSILQVCGKGSRIYLRTT